MFILFIAITTSLIIFNISGMIPFAFAVTSHFITTFFYSFSLFFGINYIAIIRHKEKFFNIFLPQGTPIFLLPLLVALEFVSYFSRLFSLGIRLFANIMAGHALLSIFTSFAFKAIVSGGFPMMVSCIGIAILFAVIFMEVAIAFLQVFVFLTLTALYVVDVHSVNH
jgi:F-type H+-transporting ATPase subunit a